MSIEEYIKIYEELQKYKRIVANIDKDYFFEFVDNLLSDYIKQKQINEEHEKEIAELKEYIFIAPNLDEMTATKYANIQREAYTKGRAEEQQRAEYIIYKNFIPKQKIKDLIKNETINISGFECIALENLQELLEGEK